MGDDAVDSMLYAINRETGEKFAIGKEITQIPKLAPGGILKETKEPILTGGRDFDFTVKLKTITKKRFIKLLMAKGYQKNQAIKMHQEYMSDHRFVRSRLGLELFVATYNIEPSFKIKIGGKVIDVDYIKTNNM